MGLILNICQRYIPPPVQKHELGRLFEATAGAFECTAPATGGLPYIKRLDLYARFTREEAEKALREGRQSEVRTRLFENARRMGQMYRKALRLSGREEVNQAGALIYRLLGIDFQAEAGGQIVIRQCFFSRYYSGRVCGLISALDEGLLSGLSGGGMLSFSRRITEGHPACLAFLAEPGRQP
jgi:hypothetical protein